LRKDEVDLIDNIIQKMFMSSYLIGGASSKWVLGQASGAKYVVVGATVEPDEVDRSLYS
jgi:hypothetical protein